MCRVVHTRSRRNSECFGMRQGQAQGEKQPFVLAKNFLRRLELHFWITSKINVCLSVGLLSASLPACLSACLSISLPVYLSACLSCLSVCLVCNDGRVFASLIARAVREQFPPIWRLQIQASLTKI